MLDHINMSVRNLSESIQWYGNLFGFEVVERGDSREYPWAIIKKDESMLCLYENQEMKFLSSDEAEEVHHIYHFALRIDDQNQWKDLIQKYSLSFYYPSPQRYPHSTSWYIKDPTGYAIEVVLWDEKKAQF